MSLYVLKFFLFAMYIVAKSIGHPVNEEDPISTKLKFIASVDGKSFFADNSMQRAWNESSIYCKSMQMNLASITSTAQWQALVNAYDSTDFFDGHWTSGRDALELRQFSWNTSNSDSSALGFKFENYRNVGIGSQTCLAFVSLSNQESLLYPRECSKILYVLCETS